MTSQAGRGTLSICVSVILLLCGCMAQAELASGTDAGKRTMSKFVITLAKFITWPDASFENETSAFRYCLPGEDGFGIHVLTPVIDNFVGTPVLTVQGIENFAQYGGIPRQHHVIYFSQTQA